MSRRRNPRPRKGRGAWTVPLAAAGSLGLVAVLGLVATPEGGSATGRGIAAVMTEAGCTFRQVRAGPAGHTTRSGQPVRYNTYPPSSGVHDPVPAVWGNYARPVDPRQAVHNLEHGGIVIWYGPGISAAERRKITIFYRASPNAMLVTPLLQRSAGVTFPPHEPLGSRIALTAWRANVNAETGAVTRERGIVAICPRFDAQAFRAFRRAFRGKGPERIPIRFLTPGQ